jgi:hypothetical protein
MAFNDLGGLGVWVCRGEAREGDVLYERSTTHERVWCLKWGGRVKGRDSNESVFKGRNAVS